MTRDDDPAVLRWPNWLGLVVDDLEARATSTAR